MKISTLLLALASLTALPVLAESPSPAQAWNTQDEEIRRLLKCTGDDARGEFAYKECQGCHKADASGKPEAGYPQLAGQHPTVLIKQMLDVRSGRRVSPKMHPFIEDDAVATEELAHIAAYLRTLPVPTTNGKGSGQQLELGKHLYDRDCAACHGKSGEGDAAQFYPRVAGQHYQYLLRETRESRDNGRRNSNPDMVKVLRHYVDSDIEAVSDYMSRLTIADQK